MISYCITVYNEIDQIKILLDQLQKILLPEEEIVVVQTYREESEKSSDHFLTIKDIIVSYKNIIYDTCHFNISYGVFNDIKNHATSLASKEYIFNIDADENFPENGFPIIREVISNNTNLDLIYVPRINTVDGLTQEDILKWGWNVNENGWVNWPDYQPRIYKNNKILRWEGGPHNTIIGSQQTGALSPVAEVALIHKKHILKQREQNNLYDKILEEKEMK